MDLQSFAEEARFEGAVVLNTVQAEIGDDGLVQSFLEDADVQVAHTGSDALASKLCHDKVSLDFLKQNCVIEAQHILIQEVSGQDAPHFCTCIDAMQ